LLNCDVLSLHKKITSLNNHKHNISSLPSWAQELISQLMSHIGELEAQIAASLQAVMDLKDLQKAKEKGQEKSQEFKKGI